MIQYLEQKYPRPDSLPKAEAVVVLSGMVNIELSTPGNIEFEDSVERILTGIRLMKAGMADTLIIAGGSGDLYNQKTSEARLLKQFSMEFGIPEEHILLDPNSRNTYENAVNTKALLEKHEITSFILVTSASHLPRAMGCFNKLGLNPVPYGVDYDSRPAPLYHFPAFIPGEGGFKKTASILHEYLGLAIYKLLGYI